MLKAVARGDFNQAIRRPAADLMGFEPPAHAPVGRYLYELDAEIDRPVARRARLGKPVQLPAAAGELLPSALRRIREHRLPVPAVEHENASGADIARDAGKHAARLFLVPTIAEHVEHDQCCVKSAFVLRR